MNSPTIEYEFYPGGDYEFGGGEYYEGVGEDYNPSSQPYCSPQEFKQDPRRCNLFSALITINSFPLSYVSLALIAIIIIISLFGGIKENYRWFILNQALWDLLISYDFLCENNVTWSTSPDSSASCFYSYTDETEIGFPWDYDYNENRRVNPLIYYIGKFISMMVAQQSYASLLLLTSTRFFCLYFMHFYEKLTRKRRIFYMILGFNLFFAFIIAGYTALVYLVPYSKTALAIHCQAKYGCANMEKCTMRNHQKILGCQSKYDDRTLDILWRIFKGLTFIIPGLCLVLSVIAAILIFVKIFKQMLFQFKHNRRDGYGSARVAFVLLLQSLLNSYVFALESVKNIYFFPYLFTFNGMLSDSLGNDDGQGFDPSNAVRETLADPASVQLTRQCRVLIESIIVLVIMTGYREAIFNFVAFGLNKSKLDSLLPKKRYQKKKITTISSVMYNT